eukprot:TRINITY_DN2353_c0_g1_i3.p1 TRINITY_DN2353_c0_g1~~TRINITY_DN2353_c0_g1_i3.p1  ORF type:complete len:773 (-),score=115.74 TRINITY_DN2353_c0_g1_i3:955-3273(-)
MDVVTQRTYQSCRRATPLLRPFLLHFNSSLPKCPQNETNTSENVFVSSLSSCQHIETPRGDFSPSWIDGHFSGNASFLGRRHISTFREGRMVPITDKEEKPFSKILVANRGEIACRVMRTAKRLGMRTVAVHSEPDAESPHVRMADEAICVGPAASSQSYLNMDAILDAVRMTGAEAVHPGYGFLSENAAFVTRLEEAGVVFVGPSASAIGAMGDKIESKQLAKDAKVNTIPGCQDVITSEDHAAKIGCEVGYPVMIKASAGGGGKGMRIAWNEVEVREAFRICSAEAISSFGDGRMFIEKFIEQPRHIEIQVLGDKHGNVVYLPERECSIQRRNQKVLEEAPSTFLTPETRMAMGQQAVSMAQAVQYSSAGTIECLVDKNRNFYFLEMNTRLQVEHAITEGITGLDIVEIMFRVAAGERLLLSQEEAAKIFGWAIESRVYAEHPSRGFLPSNGRLRRYQEPSAKLPEEIVRVDSGVEEGSDISIYYDPMISKLITWGPDRASALKSTERALDRYVVEGMQHNVPFLRSIVAHPAFVEGNISTGFLKEHYPKGWNDEHLSDTQKTELAAISGLIHIASQLFAGSHTKRQSSKALETHLVASIDNVKTPIVVKPVLNADGRMVSAAIKIGDADFNAEIPSPPPGGLGVVEIVLNGELAICQIIKRLPRGFQLVYAGATREVIIQSPVRESLSQHMPPPKVSDFSKVLRSPMPGALVSVAVKVGQEVAEGVELAVIEAMKMRNVLRAERAGKVKAILPSIGSTLAVDQVIIQFE